MQLYHLELDNNKTVALNILIDNKIIFISYCYGSIAQDTAFYLHKRYSWRLWYLGWSMHNSDFYKYVHFDDYLLQPLGLNSL